jgi:small subunit ribosomal protein S3
LGHKVHPIGFRIGIIQDWQAKWYADAHYAESLREDMKLRQTIQSKYADAAISLVEIDRQAKEISVTIHTARPGIVIGRGGQRVDELSSHLEKLIGKRVRLNIQEIRQPELDANLVAKTIAEQIQRRIAYRRAMKQAIFRTIQAGAKGIRISCAGRLGDAEIARRQTMHEGQVPLHTIRADIDYGFTEARTTLGRIGVKVWIYKGEILPELKELEVEEMPAELAAVKSAEAEPATAVEPEAELAEPVAAETAEVTAEVAPEAAPEEKPAKPTTRRRKAAAPAEPEKPVVAKTAKAVAEVKAEEKPAKPVTKRRKVAAPTKPAEKPEEPAVAEAAKAVAEVKAEEKPAKPVTRKRKVAAPAEPEKPVVAKTAKAAVKVKAEEKSAKPARKRSKKAATATDTTTEAEAATLTVTEKEEKDAAT